MSDLKIQGEVVVSTEGAESALNRVGNAAESMARQVDTSASKAGKAVDGIGSGADASAEQFTRAEGKISASIKRATSQLEMLGKTASQKLDIKIAAQGLDAAKFEPMLAKLRELEAAQVRVGTTSRGMGGGLQNTSYQLQDFIVQVNGGVDATKALGMQLPQMLAGFGAAGAAVGVLAALLPNLVQAFGSSAEKAKTLDNAMSDLDKAVGAVGATVKTFDMDKLYEQFNASSGAVRQATLDQLAFQQEFIRTQQLVSSKKFGESLGGLGDYGTLDKLAGAYAGSGADKLAKQLGVTLEVAKDLLPTLNGLKTGSEDVNLAFTKFGTALLGGNAKAVELAATMNDLAKAQRDGAAASTAISEAQAKMAKGYVQTKKEADETAKAHNTAAKAAQAEADALAALLNTINGKASDFDSSYVKNVETLLKAYDRGALKLGEFNAVFERYVALQPGAVAAEKERAKLLKEEEDYRQKSISSLASETEKLLDKAKASEIELAAIGATGGDLERLTAARYDEQIAIKQAEAERLRGIDGREAELYLIEQQITALQRLKSVEITKPKLQAQAREWEKFTDQIGQSLTDALYRAFESGDSFGQAFAKNLENTFKAMVLKFAVQAAITTGGNLVNTGINAVLGTGGENGGAGTNYFGLADKANSIYNLYGAATGYSTGVNTLAGLLGAGSTVGASAGSLAYANTVGAIGGDALGAFIAANNSWAGVSTAAATAAEASAAAAAASAAEAGAASAAGGAAASAGSFAWVPYVGWAAAAAAAIYAFKDKLFGGSWEPTGAPRFSGSFSEVDRGMVNGNTLQDWAKDGGWFRSDKNETRATAISNEFDALLDRIYTGVRDNYLAVGKLFDDTDLADKLVGFGMRVDNLDFSDAQAAVEKMAKDLADSMGRTLFPSVQALQK
ncbi:MAG: hypothetical protein ABFC67_03670, partial [Mizugakiibacter sp.]|uniref:hypothetical protein n=1 Tax=Mizugakiibacter sp. TaxID=1972610 RepID=UPI0032105A7B